MNSLKNDDSYRKAVREIKYIADFTTSYFFDIFFNVFSIERHSGKICIAL